ncbi:MAG: NUDIX hydrolase [Candidatus Saccharibacteria bacterium]
MTHDRYPQPPSQAIRSVKLAIANRAGHYLLLRRAADDKNRPGSLDLAGGGVDPLESPRQAAVREAWEELGIVLGEDQIKLLYPVRRPSSHGHINERHFGRVVLPDANPAIVLDPGEHSSYLWLPRDEARASLTHQPLREGFVLATGHLALADL